MYYSGNADSSCRTDFNTNAVFRMSYEPLGFWDRLFEWLCFRLALCVEALSEEDVGDGDEKEGKGSDLQRD